MGNDQSTSRVARKDAARSSRSFTSVELASERVDLDLLGEIPQLAGLEPAVCRQLELAFQEAVANCLEHGNLELDSSWREEIDAAGLDRYARTKAERLASAPYCNRRVTIIAEFDGFDLEIRVGDEGPGFIPKARPITEGDLMSSGRGLALIEQYLDEVRYEKGGREVVMRKMVRPR